MLHLIQKIMHIFEKLIRKCNVEFSAEVYKVCCPTMQTWASSFVLSYLSFLEAMWYYIL
jgi:hypothetical protein